MSYKSSIDTLRQGRLNSDWKETSRLRSQLVEAEQEHMRILSRFLKPSWLGCIAVAFASGAISIVLATDDETPESPRTAAAVRLMHDEVSKIRVSVERTPKNVDAELKPEAILRYTDQQRDFPDATLWVWMVEGRPVTFSKLERFAGVKPLWQHCAVGVHEKIIMRWPKGVVWKSRAAGTTFRPLEDESPAAKTAPLRLAQFRTIARKFRATTTDRDDKPEEMRLLPQPILRYSNTDQGLVDGAVFAFTSNGTNPDALLLLQVSSRDGNSVWEFGCLGMSGDQVVIERNEKHVFEHLGSPVPGDHGHWLWLLRPID